MPDAEPDRMRRDAAGAVDAAAAAVVAEAVGRLRANGHLYFELEPAGSSGIAVAVRHHRPEDSALAEYGERFYAVDPLTAAFRDRLHRNGASAPGPAIVALGELPHDLRASYENRFLHRAGIADVLGLGVPVVIGGRPRMLCFGFHRSPTDPAFTAKEKRILARLADGLRLRAESLALREALALQTAIGRALVEDDGRGWLLLDDRLQVRQVGGAVRTFTASGVEGIGNALRFHLRSGPRTGTVGPVVLHPGPGGVSLVADPVWPTTRERWWLVRPLRGPAAVNLVANAAAAELTGREREVADLLVIGHGNRQLARELGLTINTVENHLRSIYAKLGVRSRGQATARMLGSDANTRPDRER